MTDLYVTPFTPTLAAGANVGTYGVVRALAMLGPLDLLYVAHGAAEPAPEYGAIEGLTIHVVQPSRGLRRGVAYARARAAGVPRGWAKGVSTELIKAATRLAGAPGRDRVIADGPVAAAALSRLARERPVVYSAHDLESAFRHDVEGSSAGSRRAIERFERNLLGTFVESWMVSRQDTAGARALAPGAQVRYVPAVVDVSAIRPVTAPPGRRRMLYVANFHWPPNRTGLRFLIDEVLPRVWEELPDAHLTIVGRGLSAPPSDDPRIETLGFVDDLGSAYRDADCVVVPLLDGGGVPIKFIEALAYGVPIVATPKAASGLDARAGEHYLEGADGAAFAAAAAGVLRSGAPDVGTAARDLAEREYSIEAVSRRITPGAPLD